MPSSKNKELVKNTIVISLGKISTQFVSFLLLPIYTLYLTASEFGQVDLITVIVILIAPIVMLSLEMATFRSLVDTRDNKKQQQSVITNSLHTVGTSVFLVTTTYLILSLFISFPYQWLLLIAVLATILANYSLQVARGFGDNIKYAIGSLVAGITSVTLNVIMIAVLHMGATGMLLATIVGNIFCAIYLIFSLKIYRYIKPELVDNGIKKELLGYSLPLVPNGVSWWIVNAADRMIITAILGMASNGIYAVAYKFPQIFTAIYSFFGMSWTESASVHIKSKDRDQFFSAVANASLRLFGSFGIVIIIGVALFFPALIDSQYAESRQYIPLLIIGALANSVVGTYSAIYVARKKTKQVLHTSLIAAGTSLMLSTALTPIIGLYGPTIAYIMAFGSMAVVRHFDIKKHIHIRYDWLMLLKLAIIYVVVISLYYLDNLIANISAAAFAGVALPYLSRKDIIKIYKFGINKVKRQHLHNR